MKSQTIPVICALTILMASWTDAKAADGLLFLTKQGDVFLYQPDQATTLTHLMKPEDLPQYPRDGINAPVYDPFSKKLFFKGGVTWGEPLGGILELGLADSGRTYKKINVPAEAGDYLLFDYNTGRVVTNCRDAVWNEKRTARIVRKRWFVYLDKDGTWKPLDESKPLNCVRYNIRPESIPGGEGVLSGKDLFAKSPDMKGRVDAFAEDEPWKMVGRSHNLTLHFRRRGVGFGMKDGEALERSTYLIEDRKNNGHEVFVVPKSGGGYVFLDFIVIVELVSKVGWPSRGKEDRTGDWYLYYSGAKQIFKTHMDNAFKLQTADEDKGLLYLTADEVLYELPVSIEGWGQPRKLAKLPIEPDWVFVVPESVGHVEVPRNGPNHGITG